MLIDKETRNTENSEENRYNLRSPGEGERERERETDRQTDRERESAIARCIKLVATICPYMLSILLLSIRP